MMTLNILSLCNWPMYLLAWLLPFILGWIVGRSFLGKYKKTISELEQKSTHLQSHANSLEADLNSAKKSKKNIDRENKLLRGQLQDKNDRIKSSESRILVLKKSHKEELEKFKTKQKEQHKNKLEKDKEIKTLREQLNTANERISRSELNLKEALQKLDKKEQRPSKQLFVENESTLPDDKQEVKPIRIDDEQINKILDQQPIRPDNESNMEEVDRVKSALSAASLGKVDKILEKIEKKKKKKENKAKLKQEKEDSMAEQQKETSSLPSTESENISSIEVLPPQPNDNEAKRRGRPKGSKNKSTIERELGRGRRRDDLKKIEGVGPKIEEALRKIGYKTFKRIAASTPLELKDALLRESTRFKIASTDTWPHQARLADEDKWNELKRFQDNLNRR